MKIDMLRVALTLLLLTWSTTTILSSEKLRVAILDFKNKSQNKDYNYLEPTMTKAVKRVLKEKFVYQELEQADWQQVASDHDLKDKSEIHTKAFGAYVGHFARQDVVIGGGYRVTRQKVIADVFILDVTNKKLVKEFSVHLPADDSIFDELGKLTGRIAKEAAVILPSPEAWAKRRQQLSPPLPNQFSLVAGVGLSNSPVATNEILDTGASLSNHDFANPLLVGLEYRRVNAFTTNTALWASGRMGFGSRTFSVNKSSKQATGYLTSVDVLAGVGYQLRLIGYFYVYPALGAGYNFTHLRVDWNALEAYPLDNNGRPVTESSGSSTSPLLLATFRMGYEIRRYLSLELGATYSLILYENENSSSLAAELAVGLRL